MRGNLHRTSLVGLALLLPLGGAGAGCTGARTIIRGQSPDAVEPSTSTSSTTTDAAPAARPVQVQARSNSSTSAEPAPAPAPARRSADASSLIAAPSPARSG